MKSLFISLLLLVPVLALGQGMDTTPPKELSKISFLIGSFSGTETHTFGGPPEKATASISGSKGVGGRYIMGRHTSKSKSMTLEGMNMLTYDPEQKKYRAWWFDNASSYAMELSGSMKGSSLVLVSTPTPIPGMQEPVTFRATYTNAGAKRVSFLLEMQQGDQWVPAMRGDYRRK